MKNTIHIGIIGNYKGHLSAAEQVEESDEPNGIFVIHNTDEDTLTHREEIKYPAQGTNVDIEPEFILRCDLSYQENRLANIEVKQMTIGNDFTIRQLEGSEKISQRKAWGGCSKGLHDRWWDVSSFTRTQYGDEIKLVSYIEREGEFYLSTPMVDFSETKLFFDELLSWIIDRINNQQDQGMYEKILPELERLGFPDELILFTGAPNYTQWGEKNFLNRGDTVHIAAFNEEHISKAKIKENFSCQNLMNNLDVLQFSQRIV